MVRFIELHAGVDCDGCYFASSVTMKLKPAKISVLSPLPIARRPTPLINSTKTCRLSLLRVDQTNITMLPMESP